MLGHETLSSCCHARRHVEFPPMQLSFVLETFKVKCNVNLDNHRLLDQSQNVYITGQGPSSSSVK